MIRDSVHLTRESIADCFQQFRFDPPWIILQNTFARLETALQTRHYSLSGSTANRSHDIYVLTPDYPQSDMIPPTWRVFSNDIFVSNIAIIILLKI